MRELEADIEARAVGRILRETGVPSSKLGQQGDPDRIFWIPGGKPLIIEFKRPGEYPRPLQVEKIRRLVALGYNVGVADNVDDALRAVQQALDATRLPA